MSTTGSLHVFGSHSFWCRVASKGSLIGLLRQFAHVPQRPPSKNTSECAYILRVEVHTPCSYPLASLVSNHFIEGIPLLDTYLASCASSPRRRLESRQATDALALLRPKYSRSSQSFAFALFKFLVDKWSLGLCFCSSFRSSWALLFLSWSAPGGNSGELVAEIIGSLAKLADYVGAVLAKQMTWATSMLVREESANGQLLWPKHHSSLAGKKKKEVSQLSQCCHATIFSSRVTMTHHEVKSARICCVFEAA